MRIEDEIQQKQFSNANQKAAVNILFTASWLSQKQTRILRPYGLSMQQFNILRILRGMKGKPATVKILTQRMIDRTSNASRLVDKLVNKGWVRRETCEEDRRQLDVYISDKGLEILQAASKAIDEAMPKLIALETEEAETLSLLLDKLRVSKPD